ncbi:hypothetical protein [Legionella bozemanae]|uniref:hypothetical protein n=1 Tax=Legionella bozemanae TaxID=447 RepID=UPI00399D3313
MSLNLKYKNLKHSTALPKAFTEKGMDMLATILKSPKATKPTISIIEPFAKVREILRTIKILSQSPQNSPFFDGANNYQYFVYNVYKQSISNILPKWLLCV